MIEPDKNAQIEQMHGAIDHAVMIMFSLVHANPMQAQELKRQIDKLNKVRYATERIINQFERAA